MVRHPSSEAEHRQLATYADVHRVFKHISEIQALAILALRPTADEVDEAAWRLGRPKRRMAPHCDAGVLEAITGILAGVDTE